MVEIAVLLRGRGPCRNVRTQRQGYNEDTSITGSVRMFPDHDTTGKRFVGQDSMKDSAWRRGVSFCVLMLAAACFCLPYAGALAAEETPEDKGLRIALESNARNEGFGGTQVGLLVEYG